MFDNLYDQRRRNAAVFESKPCKPYYRRTSAARYHRSCTTLCRLEIPNDNINAALLGTICDDIMRFVRSEVASNNKVVYQMQGKILTNDSDILSSRDNFVYQKDLHYTPSFIGEKAYKENGTYIGFMLSEPREISL